MLLAVHSPYSALHSKAIDEQVERGDSRCDTMDRDLTDTHSEVFLQHIAALFSRAPHTTDPLQQKCPASYRCAHPLSSGNSQRNFMQL